MNRDYAGTVRYLRRLTGPEKACYRRHSTNWLAELHTAKRRSPCVVEDVSAAGARLRAAVDAAERDLVYLVLVNFGSIEARIAWRRADRIGLRFTANQSWVMDLVRPRAAPDHTAAHDHRP
jgi:hypothetical protein